jgi:hypothetical protein
VSGPAKKKIRLTFFWADEKAVVQDFLKKHSEKMVEWANAFFGRYGLELDVVPRPGGKAEEAYQYCLVKSGGVEPDRRSASELDSAVLAEKLPTLQKWFPLWKELDEVDTQHIETVKTMALDSLREQIRAVPPGHPDRAELEARFDQLFDEFLIWSKDIAQKRVEVKRLEAITAAIDAKYVKQRHELDYDTPMRLQLGSKILAALGLGLAGLRTRANAAMAADDRLKVVHCRFYTVNTSVGERANYLGATQPEKGFNVADGKFAWGGQYLIINTNRHEDITLAHEIVHAAGRGHIPPKAKLKDLGAHARSLTMDPRGKLIVPPVIELVDQGHFDGPPDDIINYETIGKKPEDVKLYPDDEKLLKEKADFVER